MTNTWMNQLEEKLSSKSNKETATTLIKKYQGGITHTYMEKNTAESAAIDIILAEKLNDTMPIQLSLYEIKNSANTELHIKLYQNTVPSPPF